MKDNFKYKQKFDSSAKFNFGKAKVALASHGIFDNASLSNLDGLRALLPEDAVIEDNSDLLYTSFNAAVVNLINANDHGIATDTALEVSKYFVSRQMNLEHDKYDIVGHIISQGFSSFKENKMLEPDSLKGTKDPFNICLGAIVYKLIRGYVAEYIEESADPKSYCYGDISASWEIGYNDFDIVLGSKKIADAEIISDEKQIKEFSEFLRANGGTGFTEDGVPVYSLIKGSDVRPLGCAFTMNPAAAVKGVFTASAQDEKPSIEERIIEISSSTKQIVEAAKKEILDSNKEYLENISKISSQKEKNIVNTTSMKIKSIEDITPEFLAEANANAIVKSFIKDELSKEATKISEITSQKESLDAELTSTKASLEKVEGELNEIKRQLEETKRQEAFSARMSEITEEFELSKDQASVVASQIKGLEDSAFSDWKKQFVLFATKKESKKEEPKEEKTAEAALKTAKVSTAALPNAQQVEEETENFGDILKKVIVLK